MNALDAARACLAKLPPAISGAGGHAATFRATCCLVRYGLSDADAWALLREWNGTHCQPPWTEKELMHKLEDARRVAGYRVRAFIPKPAVRLTWKIEVKTPNFAKPIQPPQVIAATAESVPYFTASGDLIIPFNSPARFHWWKEGGMTLLETRHCLKVGGQANLRSSAQDSTEGTFG